jgi:Galactose oxidase, central domain
MQIHANRTDPLHRTHLRHLLAGVLVLALFVIPTMVAVAAPSNTAPPSDPSVPTTAESTSDSNNDAELEWPQRRFAPCGAFDDTTSTMFVFGGRTEGGLTHHGDAWALDTASTRRPTWQRLSDSSDPSSPPAMRSCSAAYDSIGERLIVFAGWNGSVMQNSVWSLDLGGAGTPTWSRRCDATSCGASPTLRRASSMVYDPTTNEVVVFGGLDGSYRNDLWVLGLDDTPTWTQRPSTGAQPDPRGGHSVTFDAQRQRLWLFGGTSTGNDFGDTWWLDLDTGVWTRVVDVCPDGCPSARSGATLVHDTANDQLVLYGGWNSDTDEYPPEAWALRDLGGTPTWGRIGLNSERPQARFFHVSAYDSSQHRMVTFGGGSSGNAYKDSLALLLPVGGDAAWRGIQPITPLTARDQVAVAFDTRSRRLTTFGGFGSGVFPGRADAGTHLADTFQIRLGAVGRHQRWRNVTPTDATTVPIEREATAYAHDAANHRLYLFGGLTGDVELNDVWIVDATNTTRPQWRQLCSPTSCGPAPSQRWGGHAVLDERAQRLVVFGGRGADGVAMNDTWELDLSAEPTWRELTPNGPVPPARWGGAAMLDTADGQRILFGGQTGPDASGTTLADTWALSLADRQWRRLDDSGVAPTPRRSPGYATVVDGHSTTMAVIGGLTTESATHHNDVWILDVVGDAAQWTEVAADRCDDDNAPMCRRSASVVFDPIGNDLVMVFGRDATKFVADTWRFNLERSTWCQERTGGTLS